MSDQLYRVTLTLHHGRPVRTYTEAPDPNQAIANVMRRRLKDPFVVKSSRAELIGPAADDPDTYYQHDRDEEARAAHIDRFEERMNL